MAAKIYRIPSRDETPWTNPNSYEPEPRSRSRAKPSVTDAIGGLVDAIGDFISNAHFLVGVTVGTWLTVGAAFLVAFR